MTLGELNALSPAAASRVLTDCCGASAWVREMVNRRPFGSVEELLAAARSAWAATEPADWEEAFAHHPRIGEAAATAPTAAQAQAWSRGEQHAMTRAPEELRRRLAEGNRAYEQKFGRIFIVAASGKSPEELLEQLERRLANRPFEELSIAAREQGMITELRLARLMADEKASPAMSRITTHVLDTARGKPAQGIAVSLERVLPTGPGEVIGRSVTDADGRVRDFGGTDLTVAGRYRLGFDTGAWFAAQGMSGFFPRVVIEFEIPDGAGHYHVPLLLSPFGYSTYRGS